MTNESKTQEKDVNELLISDFDFFIYQEILAHWSVLVMCPYFESLYNSGLKEKISGKNMDYGKRSYK
jgi:hypothetical protein